MKHLFLLIALICIGTACTKTTDSTFTPEETTPITQTTEEIKDPDIINSNESSEPEENSSMATVSHRFQGKWNFRQSRGDIMDPYFSNIPAGTIIWDFKANNQLEVTVNTTFTDHAPIRFQTSCTVNYSVSGSKITLDGLTYDYFLKDGKLNIFANPHACGPWYIFERD